MTGRGGSGPGFPPVPDGYPESMSNLKSRAAKKAAKKAAKVTAKHAVHGAVSKTRRSPFHTATLLAAGTIVGAVGAWLAARSRYAPALGPGTPPSGA